MWLPYSKGQPNCWLIRASLIQGNPTKVYGAASKTTILLPHMTIFRKTYKKIGIMRTRKSGPVRSKLWFLEHFGGKLSAAKSKWPRKPILWYPAWPYLKKLKFSKFSTMRAQKSWHGQVLWFLEHFGFKEWAASRSVISKNPVSIAYMTISRKNTNFKIFGHTHLVKMGVVKNLDFPQELGGRLFCW